VLYGIAILLVLSAWYVVLTDPIYRTILPGFARQDDARKNYSLPDASVYEAKDPPIGLPLPAGETGAEIRRKTPASKHGYLLAAIGDCNSCTRLNLEKLYSQTRPRGITLVALSKGEADSVRQFGAGLRRNGVDIPLYWDRDGRLSASLNSYYPGRLYYFTPDWKLRWRERDYLIDNYLFRTGRFDRLMRNTQP
jgi:hypothetical protein